MSRHIFWHLILWKNRNCGGFQTKKSVELTTHFVVLVVCLSYSMRSLFWQNFYLSKIENIWSFVPRTALNPFLSYQKYKWNIYWIYYVQFKKTYHKSTTDFQTPDTADSDTDCFKICSIFIISKTSNIFVWKTFNWRQRRNEKI